MVHWIAILAVLVCMGDLSQSRSWVSFDDDDDYEVGLSDPDDEPNWKSRYYKGGDPWWGSEEDYEEPGYGKKPPCNHIHHNDREYNHDHHDGYNHQEHRNDNNRNFGTLNAHGHPGYNTGSSSNSNWGQPHHGPWGNHNQDNGYRHPGHHFRYPTQHGYPYYHHGSHGYPIHSGYSTQEPVSHSPRPTGPAKPAINSGSPLEVLPQNNQQDSRNDADRVVFPDFKNHATTSTGVPTTSSQSAVVTTPTPTTTTDKSLLDLVICVRACPTTPEYNPVCGSNNVTYNNPGVLQCTRNCGLDVTIASRAPCPRPIPRLSSTMSPITNSAPFVTAATPAQATTTTTAAPTRTPTVKPTRYTNIDVIPVDKSDTTAIPLNVLQSIFGNAPPSTTEEPEFDIDKRKVNRN